MQQGARSDAREFGAWCASHIDYASVLRSDCCPKSQNAMAPASYGFNYHETISAPTLISRGGTILDKETIAVSMAGLELRHGFALVGSAPHDMHVNQPGMFFP